jgi:hypothetical protein
LVTTTHIHSESRVTTPTTQTAGKPHRHSFTAPFF